MLPDSENDFRLDFSLQASDQVWWEWFPSNGRMIVQSAGPCILGYDLFDGVLHRDYWAERLHPDDSHRVLESLESHLAGKTDVWQIEHRFLARGGQWIWVGQYGQVIDRSPEGVPVRVVGLTRQVHDSHFLARLFHEADDTVRGLCNALPIAFWIRDGDGRVVIASAVASARWPNLRGSRVGDLAIDEAEASRWNLVLGKAARGEGQGQRHLRRICEGNEIVEVELETRRLTGREDVISLVEWIVHS